MKKLAIASSVLVSRSALADPGLVAPVAEGASTLGSVLASNGGWGMAGVFAIVIWRLWKSNGEKDERIFGLLDKQNEILKVLEKLDGRKSP